MIIGYKHLQIYQRKVEISGMQLQRSPTIAVIGLADSGKTVTIQRLFKTNSGQQPVYKQPLDVRLIEAQKHWTIFDISVRLPSIQQDLAVFDEQLAQCDVILWVMDIFEPIHPNIHHAIHSLSQYDANVIIGLNKIDRTPPFNWDAYLYITSTEQQAYIQSVVQRTYDELKPCVNSIEAIVPFTAEYYLGLVDVLYAIINAVPDERAIFLDSLKDLRVSRVKSYLAEYIYY